MTVPSDLQQHGMQNIASDNRPFREKLQSALDTYRSQIQWYEDRISELEEAISFLDKNPELSDIITAVIKTIR